GVGGGCLRWEEGGRASPANLNARGVHPDHHALWINPKDSRHLVLGNDGGLYYSHDRGRSWEAIRNLPIGQFYGVAADMRKPYRVYGGLPDNGHRGRPHPPPPPHQPPPPEPASRSRSDRVPHARR